MFVNFELYHNQQKKTQTRFWRVSFAWIFYETEKILDMQNNKPK